MKNGRELRDMRVVARVPGHLVAKSAEISRARLSEIERGQVKPPEEELLRIETALTRLIKARQKLAQIAAEYGWPMTAV